jgi:heme-degrading monooxygenase HmoA
MKNAIITELLKVEAEPATTDEQMIAKADVINAFLKNQDGFIDAELVKGTEGNTWYFIYHIENFEKLKAAGEKLRSNRMFDQITPLIMPDCMKVSFYNQLKKW